MYSILAGLLAYAFKAIYGLVIKYTSLLLDVEVNFGMNFFFVNVVTVGMYVM